jgi:hypothetical protein
MEFQASRKSFVNENGEIKNINCEAGTGGVCASNIEIYWHPMAITGSSNRTAMLCSRNKNMGPSYKTAGYHGY